MTDRDYTTRAESASGMIRNALQLSTALSEDEDMRAITRLLLMALAKLEPPRLTLVESRGVPHTQTGEDI